MNPEEAYEQFLCESRHATMPRAGFFVIVMRREPQVGQCGIDYLDPELDFPTRESAEEHLAAAAAECRVYHRDGWRVVPEFAIHNFAQRYIGRTN